MIEIMSHTGRTVISLGAGVQSTAMMLMSLHGEIPKADCAIFADTGAEPEMVYEHLGLLKKIAKDFNFPLHVVDNGNIEEDIYKAIKDGKRVASMPFFTKSKAGTRGKLWRQCTSEYKIIPIRRKLKQLYPNEHINLMIGISLDEVTRVKPSNVKWITNLYPLIDNRITRYDCLQWLKKMDYPDPPKSSCYFCPFHDNAFWREMKMNQPEEFNKAVRIDKDIKGLPKIRGEPYLHRDLEPLDKIDFRNAEDRGQMVLFEEECEGYCGV